jgi:predicted transcriptional regulator
MSHDPAFEDMAPHQHTKKEISLDLSDIEHSARICKALSSETRLEILRTLIEQPMTISQLSEKFYLPMSSMSLHIRLLNEAGLITMVSKPGVHGLRKLCGISASSVTLDLFAHTNQGVHKPPAYVNMPVGHYCNCEVTPPCGIASANFYIHEEDSPYGFYSPEHVDASLLWFTSGMLEYHFSTDTLQKGPIEQIEFSFELCSEAPGYRNEWPSDIELELNGHPITTMHIKGDYGGRRGIYNPSWWSDTSTQFGEYKIIYIRHDGCYMDNQKISDETIESLNLTHGYYFSFLLKVDPNSKCVGGMNLFGKYFGDYAQDIVMKVEYK